MGDGGVIQTLLAARYIPIVIFHTNMIRSVWVTLHAVHGYEDLGHAQQLWGMPQGLGPMANAWVQTWPVESSSHPSVYSNRDSPCQELVY